MFKVAVVFFLGMVAVAATVWLYEMFGAGGVTEQKSIFATMQGVELMYRAKPLSTPYFLETNSGNESLYLVGVPNRDSHFPYAWIELRRELNSSEYKTKFYMMPYNAKIKIQCSDAETILRKNHVSIEVIKFIKENCIAS